jgi:hypothetical protein
MWRLDGNVVVIISRTRARRASPSTPPNPRSSPGDQVLQETAARRAFERARERWREKTGCTRTHQVPAQLQLTPTAGLDEPQSAARARPGVVTRAAARASITSTILDDLDA